MDKLTVTSAVLFGAADVLAVSAVLMPDWIVTTAAGSAASRVGLLRSCLTLHDRPESCHAPASLPPEWVATLVLALGAVVAAFAALVLSLASNWDHALVGHARWSGFAAMNLFCLAAVLFPAGFSNPEIGGTPYQLPNSYQVGIGYILFIMALWLTVISELFATRICLPHL